MTKERLFGVTVACLLCTGCSRAPSISIIGSFFPVWMVCLVASVILAFAVRFLLLRYRLESDMGPVALFYPSVVALFTCLLWLVFFR
ncbi:YtcA family lipoprotein [Edaphobacter aggregans]|uniref:YtcA family lipoprotein n=1 Tax=Edaphobacter aggregans TaxID=570835 RepID=UPI0005559691|nr:YtcA family lipoprotein [Edaphobacter aggregans]